VNLPSVPQRWNLLGLRRLEDRQDGLVDKPRPVQATPQPDWQVLHRPGQRLDVSRRGAEANTEVVRG